MMKIQSRWPAKLLLFGEHTVLRGSRALAVPLQLFGASWRQSDDLTKQYDLPKMAAWLREQPTCLGINVDKFERALSLGWCLDSDVPLGYGAGSSGVVCAALLAVFGTERGASDLVFLKQRLADIESFFHGSSSGIDPLVSFLKRPILVSGGAAPTIWEAPIPRLPEGSAIFLMDTRLPRNGAPYIEYVARQCALPDCSAALSGRYLAAVNGAMEGYLGGDWDAVLHNTLTISQFQAVWWPEIIPKIIRPAWQKGLQTGAYILKTCGAGGGGFALGFTSDWAETQHILADWRLHRL